MTVRSKRFFGFLLFFIIVLVGLAIYFFQINNESKKIYDTFSENPNYKITITDESKLAALFTERKVQFPGVLNVQTKKATPANKYRFILSSEEIEANKTISGGTVSSGDYSIQGDIITFRIYVKPSLLEDSLQGSKLYTLKLIDVLIGATPDVTILSSLSTTVQYDPTKEYNDIVKKTVGDIQESPLENWPIRIDKI